VVVIKLIEFYRKCFKEFVVGLLFRIVGWDLADTVWSKPELHGYGLQGQHELNSHQEVIELEAIE
jgi:hypothetical protein